MIILNICIISATLHYNTITSYTSLRHLRPTYRNSLIRSPDQITRQAKMQIFSVLSFDLPGGNVTETRDLGSKTDICVQCVVSCYSHITH